MNQGKTFIISGPSGVGKSTVLHALFDGPGRPVFFRIRHHPRTPGGGTGRRGLPLHPRGPVPQHDRGGRLSGVCRVCGQFYGTPKKFVDEAMESGRDVILDIEIQGRSRYAPTAGNRSHFYCAAFLGRIRAEAHGSGHGRRGQGAKAAAAGEGGAENGGSV